MLLTMSCCGEDHITSKSKNEFHMKPSAGTNCKTRINVVAALFESCIVKSLELKHNHTLISKKRLILSLH